MPSVWKRLVCFVVGAAVYPPIFLVSAVIQCTQTLLPPGRTHEALALRFCQTWLVSGILLGIVLEALGLSSFAKILRLWTNGLPARADPSLVIWEQEFDGVPVRIYSPKTLPAAKRKAVLYFHGGAGIVGSVDNYERFLRSLAKEGDSVVVLVRYGLGPENPFPNQRIECVKAAIFFMKHTDRYGVDSSQIIISGDSFGGCIAAHVCQFLVGQSDLPKVRAQALLYPVLQGMDLSLPSYQQNNSCPFLWRRMTAFCCCVLLNQPTSLVDGIVKGNHVPEATREKYRKWVSADLVPEQFKARGYTPPEPSSFDPQLHEAMKAVLSETWSPLFAEDAVVAKLPPTFLLTCEYDILRDDGLLYLRRLTDNRVPVTWSHVENGVHGVAILYGVLPVSSAKRAMGDLIGFIRGLAETKTREGAPPSERLSGESSGPDS